MAGLLEGTLLETNISHLEKKKHRQKCFGRGYVSSLEGTVVLVFHFLSKHIYFHTPTLSLNDRPT